MIETKVHKEDDCAVMTLTPEMLALLGAQVGETLRLRGATSFFHHER